MIISPVGLNGLIGSNDEMSNITKEGIRDIVLTMLDKHPLNAAYLDLEMDKAPVLADPARLFIVFDTSKYQDTADFDQQTTLYHVGARQNDLAQGYGLVYGFSDDAQKNFVVLHGLFSNGHLASGQKLWSDSERGIIVQEGFFIHDADESKHKLIMGSEVAHCHLKDKQPGFKNNWKRYGDHIKQV